MSETNEAAPDAAGESAAIAAAVEGVLAKQHGAPQRSDAQKLDVARSIYARWRNARLRGLNAQAYSQVEIAAPDLIAAIAAEL